MILSDRRVTIPGKSIDPPTSLDLFGGHGQSQLLLQRAGNRTPDAVMLPRGRLGDLCDGGALWRLQHGDQLRLLRAGPLGGGDGLGLGVPQARHGFHHDRVDPEGRKALGRCDQG